MCVIGVNPFDEYVHFVISPDAHIRQLVSKAVSNTSCYHIFSHKGVVVNFITEDVKMSELSTEYIRLTSRAVKWVDKDDLLQLEFDNNPMYETPSNICSKYRQEFEWIYEQSLTINPTDIIPDNLRLGGEIVQKIIKAGNYLPMDSEYEHWEVTEIRSYSLCNECFKKSVADTGSAELAALITHGEGCK